ncbi:MAG: hypothetical protein JO256_00915 [Alphaproteobacteria bacterium]|nr:hypothetical protein [Alphaproteobacteria bacterium]
MLKAVFGGSQVRPLLVVGLVAGLVANQTATARPWKPTPQQQTQDYSTITHNKGTPGGRVVINWIAAPAFTGSLPLILEKYVVLSVTHTVTAPGGLQEYQDIEGLQVTDQEGHALKEVDQNDIPPTIVSILAALEATVRQSTQGKGKLKNLVFEAGAVHACTKNSGLVVAFEGEKYTWDTPMPGCPASQ